MYGYDLIIRDIAPPIIALLFMTLSAVSFIAAKNAVKRDWHAARDSRKNLQKLIDP